MCFEKQDGKGSISIKTEKGGGGWRTKNNKFAEVKMWRKYMHTEMHTCMGLSVGGVAFPPAFLEQRLFKT